MQDLGTLEGGGGSSANAINNLGEVVGVVGFGIDVTHAFIWDSENGMRPLESSEGTLRLANDINDAGQVVGGLMLWDHGVTLNLYRDVGLPAAWRFREVRAINASGQIVGWGENPDGLDRAFLLTPIPEPATAALLLSGLLALGVAASWSVGGRR